MKKLWANDLELMKLFIFMYKEALNIFILDKQI